MNSYKISKRGINIFKINVSLSILLSIFVIIYIAYDSYNRTREITNSIIISCISTSLLIFLLYFGVKIGLDALKDKCLVIEDNYFSIITQRKGIEKYYYKDISFVCENFRGIVIKFKHGISRIYITKFHENYDEIKKFFIPLTN